MTSLNIYYAAVRVRVSMTEILVTLAAYLSRDAIVVGGVAPAGRGDVIAGPLESYDNDRHIRPASGCHGCACARLCVWHRLATDRQMNSILSNLSGRQRCCSRVADDGGVGGEA